MGHLRGLISAPIILLPPLLHSLRLVRSAAARCFSGAESQAGCSGTDTTSGRQPAGIYFTEPRTTDGWTGVTNCI